MPEMRSGPQSFFDDPRMLRCQESGMYDLRRVEMRTVLPHHLWHGGGPVCRATIFRGVGRPPSADLETFSGPCPVDRRPRDSITSDDDRVRMQRRMRKVC